MIFWLSILLSCASTIASYDIQLKEVLTELDHTVAQKDLYEKQKQSQIDSIRLQLNNMDDPSTKYKLYNDLYSQYRYFNVDSSMHYAASELQIASEMRNELQIINANIDLATVYNTASMYSEVKDILAKYGSAIRENAPVMYYHICHSLATGLYQNNSDSSLEKLYFQKVESYRDSLLNVLGTDDISYTFVRSEKYISLCQYDKAIDTINEIYNSDDASMRNNGILNYLLASAYLGKKDTLMAEFFFAKSAISDLRTPVKEYKSLQELAYLLYETGDITRAYNYIICSTKDIEESNSRLRSQDIATILPIIIQAHDKVVERHRKVIYIILVVIVLLFCVSVILLFVVKSQNLKLNKSSNQLVKAYDKLNEANFQLKTTTRQIIELNKIKDTYVMQYMNLCSDYIDKLDKYRRDLLIIALAEPFDHLIKVIKTPNIDGIIKEFYENFDQTFIHICPNFVDDVNKLLREEEKLIPKPGKPLNTELRMLALIHLGVTDSEKIASILRCSLSTIYNYRTKLRNAAIDDRDSFEEKVANIGTIDL